MANSYRRIAMELEICAGNFQFSIFIDGDPIVTSCEKIEFILIDFDVSMENIIRLDFENVSF